MNGQGGADVRRPNEEGVAKGRRLNSIPVRFGLMAVILAAACSWLQALLWMSEGSEAITAGWLIAGIVLLTVVQAAITVVAARKLTGNINALRDSTEAIASGKLDRPIEVDCNCEVGGLADSFQNLVQRLNANLGRMKKLAHSDPLTRLPNRAVISHLIDRMVAENADGAVLFIDLDGFGRINDAFGYRAGDQLLREVGERILEAGLGRALHDLDWGLNGFGEFEQRTPRDISLARFAADQFVLVAPGVALDEACETLTKATLRSFEAPFLVAGVDCAISARIGILRLPEPSLGAAEILKFAEMACAEAAERKQKWSFFSPALREAAVDRSELERDLHHAVERGDFKLHYQPQIDSRTGELVGVEALLRWAHPVRGQVSPAVFIPIAERMGLMPMLGRFVIETAILQCAAWQAAGAAKRVAINVSASQFDDPNFVDDVLAIVRRHRVEPNLIEIEITESLAMADLPSTRGNLTRLRAAGIQIAVDDFGTGYSNLSQLAQLPFTSLKIDKSLIDGVGRSEKEGAILQSIVDMCGRLGYSIVAEGVESAGQRQLLQNLECNIHQGYLFARPMAPDDLERWELHHAAEQVERVRNLGERMRVSIAPDADQLPFRNLRSIRLH
jgi:EAL domain-containing protein (putative c-di-GMP-specific phosphodiesterase class I)/GGDEF domain-containing protein